MPHMERARDVGRRDDDSVGLGAWASGGARSKGGSRFPGVINDAFDLLRLIGLVEHGRVALGGKVARVLRSCLRRCQLKSEFSRRVQSPWPCPALSLSSSLSSSFRAAVTPRDMSPSSHWRSMGRSMSLMLSSRVLGDASSAIAPADGASAS